MNINRITPTEDGLTAWTMPERSCTHCKVNGNLECYEKYREDNSPYCYNYLTKIEDIKSEALKVAPESLERVKKILWKEYCRTDLCFKDWEPDDKTYSVDLEMKIVNHANDDIDPINESPLNNQVLVLVEKEEKSKEENKEWRCEGGYKFCQKDDQGKCSCKQPSESKEIDKIIEEFAVHSHGTAFLVMKLIDAYQQLQARVNELEKSEMILLETINGERMQHKKEVEYLEYKLKEITAVIGSCRLYEQDNTTEDQTVYVRPSVAVRSLSAYNESVFMLTETVRLALNTNSVDSTISKELQSALDKVMKFHTE